MKNRAYRAYKAYRTYRRKRNADDDADDCAGGGAGGWINRTADGGVSMSKLKADLIGEMWELEDYDLMLHMLEAIARELAEKRQNILSMQARCLMAEIKNCMEEQRE